MQGLWLGEHHPLQANWPYGTHDRTILVGPSRLRYCWLLLNNFKKLADQGVAWRRARHVAQGREEVRPEVDLVDDFVPNESCRAEFRMGFSGVTNTITLTGNCDCYVLRLCGLCNEEL